MATGRVMKPGAAVFLAAAFPVVLLAVAPVFTGSWLFGHEGSHYLFRAAEFHALQRDGVLYPGWCPDFYMGYGYPFFLFYPPGVFFLASLFQFCGASIVTAFHIGIVIGTVLLFGGTYRFCRLWTVRSAPALAGAALATAGTFRFVQYYVRGDLAEALATGLLPWALAEAVTACRARGAPAPARLALFTALIFYTHLLTAVALSGCLVVIGLAVALKGRWGGVLRLAAGSLLGLLVSAAYWLVAFVERRYVHTGRLTDVSLGGFAWSDHFVLWWQRFSPDFFFGGSVIGPGDGMSFASSYPSWILVVLAALLAVRNRAYASRIIHLLSAWLAVNLVLFPLSSPFWKIAPFMGYFQFPWRFLAFDLLFSAVLAASALDELSKRKGKLPGALIGGVALSVALLAAWQYTRVINEGLFRMLTLRSNAPPASFPYLPFVTAALAAGGLVAAWAIGRRSWKAVEFAALAAVVLFALPISTACMIRAIYDPFVIDGPTRESIEDPANLQRLVVTTGTRSVATTTTSQDEYRPLTAKIDPVRSPKYAPVMDAGAGTVERVSQKGETRTWLVSAPRAGFLRTDWLFFPGAAAEVDGAPAPIRCGKDGFVEVRVRRGKHTVRVMYAGTTLQQIAGIASIAGALLLAGLLITSSPANRNRSGDLRSPPARKSDPLPPRRPGRKGNGDSG